MRRHIVHRSLVLAFLGVAALAACKDALTDPSEAKAAREHLARVLDVMEANSINRKTINWTNFRSAVLAEAPDPQGMHDTFDAIHTALGLLGDNHSSYQSTPDYNVTLRNSRITCTTVLPQVLDVPPDIGYVRAQAFVGSGSAASSYATLLQSQIRTEDAATGVVGWIVDLRGNTGGNMWPMIAGLGPILGEGTLGYFIDPDGDEFRWEYRGGVAIVGGLTTQAVASPYVLRNPDPRVAVLIDGRVASSGEAVAIAFKGRATTRFFGTPTCGLSTANSSFALDGATLTLTVASMADRTRFVYGDTIPPDETIADPGAMLERVIAWLRGP